MIERPIGCDVKIAVSLNDVFSSVFNEKQIFRIDHYFGKEMVQNLIALRFGNRLYESLWKSNCINRVQIIFANIC
ncbi:glucose-6-phosphate 1-dehydrogenase [Bartonella fuyuanensis]|uniref:Glucose-6-phosphate 1-dehydrogenase n=1 Tax=Bartonella fuyuanensis TaxID=1460968 RepID=A0A840DZZ9_9HYPH|nr:glucose-6-phosphate 1-dehydrogenase [Bartonella fuyuanensis]